LYAWCSRCSYFFKPIYCVQFLNNTDCLRLFLLQMHLGMSIYVCQLIRRNGQLLHRVPLTCLHLTDGKSQTKPNVAVTGVLTITDVRIHSHRLYYCHFITTIQILAVVRFKFQLCQFSTGGYDNGKVRACGVCHCCLRFPVLLGVEL